MVPKVIQEQSVMLVSVQGAEEGEGNRGQRRRGKGVDSVMKVNVRPIMLFLVLKQQCHWEIWAFVVKVEYNLMTTVSVNRDFYWNHPAGTINPFWGSMRLCTDQHVLGRILLRKLCGAKGQITLRFKHIFQVPAHIGRHQKTGWPLLKLAD